MIISNFSGCLTGAFGDIVNQVFRLITAIAILSACHVLVCLKMLLSVKKTDLVALKLVVLLLVVEMVNDNGESRSAMSPN